MTIPFKTLAVPVLLGTGMLFGLLAEVLTAAMFGASDQVGLFRIAISLPALLSFAVGGAFVTASLAELISAESRSAAAYDHTYRFIRTVNLGIVASIFTVGMFTRSIQINLLAPGLGREMNETLLIQLFLCWLMFAFVGVSFHYRARLNAEGVTWLNASVTLLRYSAFAIVLLLFAGFNPKLDYPLAAAAVVSGGSILLVHVLMAFKKPMRSRSSTDNTVAMINKRGIAFSLLSITGFQVLSSLTTIFDRSIVSLGGTNLVACFDYSISMITATGSIFTGFGAIVILPKVMRSIASENAQERRRIRALLYAFFLAAFAASSILFLFRLELATIFLERGAFSAQDTADTVMFLKWYSLGLFFLIANTVFLFFFAAQKLIWFLYVVSIIRIAVRLALLNIVFDDSSLFDRVGKSFLLTEFFVAILMGAILFAVLKFKNFVRLSRI